MDDGSVFSLETLCWCHSRLEVVVMGKQLKWLQLIKKGLSRKRGILVIWSPVSARLEHLEHLETLEAPGAAVTELLLTDCMDCPPPPFPPPYPSVSHQPSY